MSHPKDTGKGGLTELPKFRTQSRPQWESNPAGKNVRSPFKANALTHSTTVNILHHSLVHTLPNTTPNSCSTILFSSHIPFLMADANAIYLSPKPYYLLLINTLRIILSSLLFTTHRLSLFLFLFSFWFSSHISFVHG